MRLRWSELGRVDRLVSVIGLTVGGLGTLGWAILIIEGLVSGQGDSGFEISALEIIAVVSILCLVPLLSALGLVLLPLRDEQRGVIGFISLISGILAMLPVSYIFFFAIYCSTIHSTCS